MDRKRRAARPRARSAPSRRAPVRSASVRRGNVGSMVGSMSRGRFIRTAGVGVAGLSAAMMGSGVARAAQKPVPPGILGSKKKFYTGVTLDTIRKNLKLRAGFVFDWAGPGFNTGAPDYEGYDSDYIRFFTIAALTGVVEIDADNVNDYWVAVDAGNSAGRGTLLQQQKVDVAAAQITMTASREAEWGAFTATTVYDGASLMWNPDVMLKDLAFRYLDADEDGMITEGEWEDKDKSILELDKTFAQLAELVDADGLITQEEWNMAVDAGYIRLHIVDLADVASVNAKLGPLTAGGKLVAGYEIGTTAEDYAFNVLQKDPINFGDSEPYPWLGDVQPLADMDSGVIHFMTVDETYLRQIRVQNNKLHWRVAAWKPLGLSEEPLTPMTPGNDEHWTGLVKWLIYATFAATKLGINKTNVVEKSTSGTPEQIHFLRDIPPIFGLHEDALINAIAAVGNWQEIWDRNMKVGLELESAPPNAIPTFSDGLFYSPVFF